MQLFMELHNITDNFKTTNNFMTPGYSLFIYLKWKDPAMLYWKKKKRPSNYKRYVLSLSGRERAVCLFFFSSVSFVQTREKKINLAERILLREKEWLTCIRVNEISTNWGHRDFKLLIHITVLIYYLNILKTVQIHI